MTTFSVESSSSSLSLSLLSLHVSFGPSWFYYEIVDYDLEPFLLFFLLCLVADELELLSSKYPPVA